MPSRRSAVGPLVAEEPPDRTTEQAVKAAERALERQRELVSLDAQVRDLDRRVDELRRSLKGRVAIGQTGQVLVVAVNHRLVKAELEQLAKRRQELVDERDAIEQSGNP